MNAENQREYNEMVRLGKDYDAVYEEILPTRNKISTSTFNTNNDNEHEYAIYNNHKRQTKNRRNYLRRIICLTLLLVLARLVLYIFSCSMNHAKSLVQCDFHCTVI